MKSVQQKSGKALIRALPLDNDKVKLIKEANDIVDVVGSYISLRPMGQTFKGVCPFHDDHRPSFDVDPKRARYRCWSCGKYGDVISFVQEYEKVEFAEALEILARRAGIDLENSKNFLQNRARGAMLDAVRWAADQYHQCLQESSLAADARSYLSSRGLEDEIIRQFGLGFAPGKGDWLLARAQNDGLDLEMLEQVGLLGRRTDKPGLYDRFRDRVMFPIRNVLGNTVGFGGRIMPNSPMIDRAPKYYNSADSTLFSKSEQLYGIDQARNAIAKAGYLAVMEGYTDVMMAHQMGICHVVATMGTAINARHLRHLRRWTQKVVLVFDSDEGGEQGVDRALEIFAASDMDLAIATLPEGLDPCDLLLKDGPEPLQKALDNAVDALEFKLGKVLESQNAPGASLEAGKKALDSLLGVLARVPVADSPSAALKVQLMLARISKKLGVHEQVLGKRLWELKPRTEQIRENEQETEQRQAKPAPEEKELMELLLANPDLVERARHEIPLDQWNHPGLKQVAGVLYALQDEGTKPEVDVVRSRLGDSPIASRLLGLADNGRRNPDPFDWYGKLLIRFKEKATTPAVRVIKDKLHSAADHATALELLRNLQSKSVDSSLGAVPNTSPTTPHGDGGI